MSRYGPVATFLLCTTTLLVGSTAVLGPSFADRLWPLIGAACFGAAYMAISSVLILWDASPSAAGAAITAWLFIALPVGKAIGAQTFGTVFT